MAAGLLIIRLFLLGLFTEVNYSSAFPRDIRYVDGTPWRGGPRRPLDFIQDLKQHHRNLQADFYNQVNNWLNPRGPAPIQQSLSQQVPSPHQRGPKGSNPPFGPRSFDLNLKIPLNNFLGLNKVTGSKTKGSTDSSGGWTDGADDSQYKPTSVQIESSFNLPSDSDDSSTKGFTKDPIGGKGSETVSKPSFQLSLFVPIQHTTPPPPGVHPPKQQSSQTQTGSLWSSLNSAGSVQHTYDPVYQKPFDDKFTLYGQPTTSTDQQETSKPFYPYPFNNRLTYLTGYMDQLKTPTDPQTQQTFDPINQKPTDGKMTYLHGHSSQHPTSAGQYSYKPVYSKPTDSKFSLSGLSSQQTQQTYKPVFQIPDGSSNYLSGHLGQQTTSTEEQIQTTDPVYQKPAYGKPTYLPGIWNQQKVPAEQQTQQEDYEPSYPGFPYGGGVVSGSSGLHTSSTGPQTYKPVYVKPTGGKFSLPGLFGQQTSEQQQTYDPYYQKPTAGKPTYFPGLSNQQTYQIYKPVYPKPDGKLNYFPGLSSQQTTSTDQQTQTYDPIDQNPTDGTLTYFSGLSNQQTTSTDQQTHPIYKPIYKPIYPKPDGKFSYFPGLSSQPMTSTDQMQTYDPIDQKPTDGTLTYFPGHSSQQMTSTEQQNHQIYKPIYKPIYPKPDGKFSYFPGLSSQQTTSTDQQTQTYDPVDQKPTDGKLTYFSGLSNQQTTSTDQQNHQIYKPIYKPIYPKPDDKFSYFSGLSSQQMTSTDQTQTHDPIDQKLTDDKLTYLYGRPGQQTSSTGQQPYKPVYSQTTDDKFSLPGPSSQQTTSTEQTQQQTNELVYSKTEGKTEQEVPKKSGIQLSLFVPIPPITPPASKTDSGNDGQLDLLQNGYVAPQKPASSLTQTSSKWPFFIGGAEQQTSEQVDQKPTDGKSIFYPGLLGQPATSTGQTSQGEIPTHGGLLTKPAVVKPPSSFLPTSGYQPYDSVYSGYYGPHTEPTENEDDEDNEDQTDSSDQTKQDLLSGYDKVLSSYYGGGPPGGSPGSTQVGALGSGQYNYYHFKPSASSSSHLHYKPPYGFYHREVPVAATSPHEAGNLAEMWQNYYSLYSSPDQDSGDPSGQQLPYQTQPTYPGQDADWYKLDGRYPKLYTVVDGDKDGSDDQTGNHQHDQLTEPLTSTYLSKKPHSYISSYNKHPCTGDQCPDDAKKQVGTEQIQTHFPDQTRQQQIGSSVYPWPDVASPRSYGSKRGNMLILPKNP